MNQSRIIIFLLLLRTVYYIYSTVAALYLALRVLNQLVDDEGAESPLAIPDFTSSNIY